MNWFLHKRNVSLTIIVGFMITIGVTHRSFGQEDLSVFNYWKYYEGLPSASLYKHLSQRAFGQLDQRNTLIGNLKTKADWQKRQADVRVKLKNSIGAFPEKTPLNPVITGTLKRDDFTVEKLYFESRPGYYVTAALFLPIQRKTKLPAIVYCSGHSANGFRADAYQRIMLNYVKKGFAVLAFDPVGQGERYQYVDEGIKKGGVHEHSQAGAQSFLSGRSSANYFIWDGIRSVDYLLTRPEIDPARIGIAGRSGGGTQSAYIAAMDDRILAAAPECYITTFDKLIRSNGPQDAEQNLMHGLKNGLDIADYLEVRAPKPTLIVATTQDIFSIQGARDAYHEAKKAYQVLGKPENMNMVEDDAGHASTAKNRMASYAFFQKYLNNPGSDEDLDVQLFSEKDLYVTPTGQVQTSLKGETMFSLNQKYTREVVDKRTKTHQPDAQKSLREAIIAASGFEKPPLKTDVIFSGQLVRAAYTIEKYLVKGSGDYYVPVLWLKPKNRQEKAVLLFDERGKTRAIQDGEVADQLAKEGHEVIVADLSGVGELGSGFMKGGDSVLDGIPMNLWFTGILTHKSLVAVRAEEISILADFVKKSRGAAKPLTASAFGTLTTDLLHASVINDPFDQIVLLNPLVSFQAVTDEKHYKTKFIPSTVAGAIPTYDLPDLVAYLSSKKLLLINPVNAAEKEISQANANSVYRQGIKKPAINGNFSVRQGVTSENYSSIVIDWIK